MSDLAKLAQTRVLVTGAGGFLGRHLCRRLIEAGADVHGMGRSPASGEPRELIWHQADCSDFAALRKAFDSAEPEVVFHLAGYADGRRNLELVLPTLSGDLVAAVNVLTAATERGCRRIVMAGSLEEPDCEDRDAIPSSPYAAAKWAATGYSRMFHQIYGTSVVTGRVFMTYGPGQRARKLVPYVIGCLQRGERPRLTGGERPVDWIYVADTVDGLLTLATTEGIEGKVLEIGSGRLVTIRDLVGRLCALWGGDVEPEFGALATRPFEQVRSANVERTQSETGWRPQISLEQGLELTLRWYREHDCRVPSVETA